MDNIENTRCECKGSCISGSGKGNKKKPSCSCIEQGKKCGPLCSCGKGRFKCTNGKPTKSKAVIQHKEKEVARNSPKTKINNLETLLKLSHRQLALVLGDILSKNPKIILEEHMMPEEEDPNLEQPESTTDQSPPDPKPQPDPGNAPGWCRCKKCGEMPTPSERVCCSDRRDTGCITDHINFERLILDREVLRLQMNIRRGAINVRALDTNRFYRHAGYKQYIAWQIGPMGRRNRRVIPSCAVLNIRRNYPNPPGRGYKGFVAIGPLNRNAGQGP